MKTSTRLYKISSLDTDREILLKLDDKSLLKVCMINKYFYNKVCNDKFFYNRLKITYPDTIMFKPDNLDWKRYFIKVIYYISKINENPRMDKYKNGNPVDIYINNLIRKYGNINLALVFTSGEKKELEIVKELLERGADIKFDNYLSLIVASKAGNLKLVKYLVEKGADIHTDNEEPLTSAAEKGYLKIVKYLIEKGADIRANDYASYRFGTSEVKKYIQKILDLENGYF